MHIFLLEQSGLVYVTPYELLQSIASTYTLQCLSNCSGRKRYMNAKLKLIRSTTVFLHELGEYSFAGILHNEFAFKQQKNNGTLVLKSSCKN